MAKLNDFLKGKSAQKSPQRKNVEKRDEFWQSSEGVAVCPRCGNYLFKKEWHHPDDVPLKDFFEKKEFEKKKHHKKMCPACTMIKNGLFEGELNIRDIPFEYRDEVINNVKAFAERAEERDPQDRIIRITKDKNSFIITTTENQLAVRIGKHLNKSFKKTELSISHSEEPYKVSRVDLIFLK